jgi:hypothetical protein
MWVPLAVLIAPENAGSITRMTGGRAVELACVRFDEHVLCGMTYRMTQALLAAMGLAP